MEVQMHSLHGHSKAPSTQECFLAEQSAQQLAEAHLRAAGAADARVQLDQSLKYVLINLTQGAAATVCRQHQHEIGLEILRQLHNRFSLPIGTRSVAQDC